MTAPALRVRASRRFGDCVALADAALEVAAGTVHALCGENGAGKSTLMRVVYGLERADAGVLELGERVDLARHDVAGAQARGVGMVHQHGMLVPTLTLADNAALGHEPVRGARGVEPLPGHAPGEADAGAREQPRHQRRDAERAERADRRAGAGQPQLGQLGRGRDGRGAGRLADEQAAVAEPQRDAGDDRVEADRDDHLVRAAVGLERAGYGSG